MRLIQKDNKQKLGLKSKDDDSEHDEKPEHDTSGSLESSDSIIKLKSNKLHYILYGISHTLMVFGHNNIIAGATLCKEDICGLYVNFNTMNDNIIWYDCSGVRSSGRAEYKKLKIKNSKLSQVARQRISYKLKTLIDTDSKYLYTLITPKSKRKTRKKEKLAKEKLAKEKLA